MRYGHYKGLASEEELDFFWQVIQALDEGYAEWQTGEHKRHIRDTKKGKQEPEPGGKTKTMRAKR